MKKTILTALALAALAASPALAEPSNSTPHALACMKKYGFTYAQWRAYAVPAEKANPYRACRDAAPAGENSGMGKSGACQRKAGFTQAQNEAGQVTPAQRQKWERCMGM
ncbi:hypothetical protein CO669_12360 [Bradyrhizobium sp. Y36]|uniref:hypothetical protein n=1 Tax=Bradyrhizobium sp. Y36 TaxID=2035447 RepID=UPI000BE94997|nr:hypothetical protein [Bradyrhizobium sp. Y36]PDT90238.1 hypothetical protein CO669_12360 [Bradyrhizobium sp. Y36]